MVTLAILGAIAAKHGCQEPSGLPTPWTGAASHVYPLGDAVVKIPFDRPDAIQAVRTDAAIAPLARSLGVQVSELITFDDSREILPVPYAVFRRIEHSVPLDRLNGDPSAGRAAWEEVGRQLAIVHRLVDPATVPIELRVFRQSPDVDPRPWVAEFQKSGIMNTNDAHWLRELLDRLAPAALDEGPVTLCHGDVNAANILVHERSHRFAALIDWAGAGWLDPVWDFAGVSLDIVPFLLAGHRSVAPLPSDHSAEARICWCQVQTRLYPIRGAAPSGPLQYQIGRHIEQVRRFARTAGLT